MAITVRGLDENFDFKFGQGRAVYRTEDNAIRQNVKTRLQSFKFDWFLDEDANIDWLNILGQKNNKNTIIENVKVTTLNTDGVISVDNIEISDEKNRNLQIIVQFTTIYNKQFTEEESLNGN